MVVEVDQSGRLEHLDTDTVIAFANGESGAVLIKVSVKRQIVQSLKRTIIPHDQLMPLLFAVVVSLLVKGLNRQMILEIDEEYTGKNKFIEQALIKMLGARWEGEVRFRLIGKESPAHKLAWEVHRSDLKKRGVRKLKLEEIMKYFVGK
ncbi:hypothetical protein A3D85_00295 [Candidatus Amesbacteria bacterium RIFCSPHIGHO2_02_FULL_47_9]|uniref:Uncharacterized protein n=1 Tax=Candidatus Amesbacteria bacterium RIFCSPHIGHO2_01_FULL_48_32b TaxID=1797253 RepID=A0A1F4YEF6_9BACT|nr:MAG: hypothetical protein A2876_02215 [Candidatus Amesbacteria bacterium RIFCSPHIGHO2_01_FULL_48_32b]OGD02442.1 MAG: hypothetical protein A3D85_00295 [Candidatus Amesbacteria bacterium RIFCSPHIGHO2_02_FULL_47_9]OGD06926.1 MAG: hypothetical protein A2899_03445 [Candidatus Amesbacteria bacterium RIFCSPLOWO2_01_FULL_49_25]